MSLNSSIKPKIFISVSDIASFIGQTHNFSYHLNFERLWKKNDEKDYLKIVHHYRTRSLQLAHTLKSISIESESLTKNLEQGIISNTNFISLESALSTKKLQLKESFKVQTERLNSILLTERQKIDSKLGGLAVKELLLSTTDTHTSKKIKTAELIDKLVKEGVLDPQKVNELLEKTNSLINTCHGIQNETSALERFESMDKVIIDRSQRIVQIHLKSLSDASHFDWFIRGKCDGMYRKEGKLHIIEVKNRVKCFYNDLRKYEVTQLQVYLWLMEAKEGILVQQFEGEIRVDRIKRNESEIKEIFESLFTFLVNFEIQFLGDFDEKMRYVGMDTKQKKMLIQKLWESN